MDTIWLILAIACILILWVYRPYQENMTNKDVLNALSRFDKHKKKTDSPSQEPIYGPRTTTAEEPKPTKAGKTDHHDDKMIYPDIYGPEITPIPGAKIVKKKPGEETSDSPDNDEVYQFNPHLQKAFPSSGTPEPFLTDFSKFQH